MASVSLSEMSNIDQTAALNAGDDGQRLIVIAVDRAALSAFCTWNQGLYRAGIGGVRSQ
jgi:hypothetical protein